MRLGCGLRVGPAAALAALLMLAPFAWAGGTAEVAPVVSEVVDLPVDGLSQRLLFVTPDHPRGVLVMLPGGRGDIGIGADGSLRQGGNFLVRTREQFAQKGYAVVVPDVAGTDNLRGRRSSPAYAGIVQALAAFAAQRTGKPVFLAGTSQGSIAAVNGAAHMRAPAIAGLVLTESVSRRGGSGETVFDADPDAVSVPVLILANPDDACPVAPSADAPRIAASLTQAPEVKIVTVTGGVHHGDPCHARSPHGYFGIEGAAVGAIVSWLNGRTPAGP